MAAAPTVTTFRGPELTTSAALAAVVPVGIYQALGLAVSGLATENISIYPSLDGGATFETAKILPYDATTGKPVAQAEMGNGVYIVDIRVFTHIKLVKSGATDTVTLKSTFY